MSYPTYLSPGEGQPQPYPQNTRQSYPPVQGGMNGGWGNPSQPGFTCRPVTSREEAVAVQVDFYGPGTIMPDLGHGMIYLKRFNPNSGASDFLAFAFCPPQPQEVPAPPYDPRQEIEALRNELEALRAELEETKKASPKRTGGRAEEK